MKNINAAPNDIKLKMVKYPFTRGNKKINIRNNVMDYFEYNGMKPIYKGAALVSEAPFNPIRAALYQDFGDLTPYIRDIKRGDLHYNWAVKNGNAPNIKVIDSPYEASFGITRTKDKPGRMIPYHDSHISLDGTNYTYDAGGHYGRMSLGDYHRESDVYKFEPKAYNKKHNTNIDSSGKTSTKSKLTKLAIKYLDKNTTPFVYQSKRTKYYRPIIDTNIKLKQKAIADEVNAMIENLDIDLNDLNLNDLIDITKNNSRIKVKR